MGKAKFIKANGKVVSQREFEKVNTPTPHCTKVQYETKASAKAGLRKVQSYPKRTLDDVRPKAVYQCSRCGYWHLTKQASREGSE